MIGEIKDDTPSDDVVDEAEEEEIEDSERVPEIDEDDNVGDISVEINVEELVAKLEATDDDDVGRKREIRNRLQELEEQRRSSQDLNSTFNFDLDDEL